MTLASSLFRLRRTALIIITRLVRNNWGLLLVVISAAVIRLLLYFWSYGFPTGDVWNFVSIAEALRRGEYPIEEKRLPFYPFLILVGHTLLPVASWEGVAVAIALIASLVALILFSALAGHFGIRPLASNLTLLILTTSRPFMIASLRGYADTVFIALLLGAVLAAVRARSWRSVLLAGGVLGCLSLTRYEGVFAAFFLLLALAWRLRRNFVRVLAAAGVMALALSPYVFVALRSGRSLLPQAYLAQAARSSYGETSVRDVAANVWVIWERLGLFEAWSVPKGFVHHLVNDPFGLPIWVSDLMREPTEAVALLAIPGVLWLLARRVRRADALAAAVPFFAITVPIAWYAPLERYDAFLQPLMLFWAAAGIHALVTLVWNGTRARGWGWVLRGGVAGALTVTTLVVWMLPGLLESIRSVQKNRGHRGGYYQSLNYLRRQTGKIAMDQYSAYTSFYFRSRGVYAGDLFRERMTEEERWRALQGKEVQFVLMQADRPTKFDFLFKSSDFGLTAEEKRFSVRQNDGTDDTWIVYRLAYRS